MLSFLNLHFYWEICLFSFQLHLGFSLYIYINEIMLVLIFQICCLPSQSRWKPLSMNALAASSHRLYISLCSSLPLRRLSRSPRQSNSHFTPLLLIYFHSKCFILQFSFSFCKFLLLFD